VTDEDFIIELFCRVDDTMPAMSKHPQAKLYPSELVTIGLVFALKGVGCRAFYCWSAGTSARCFHGCRNGVACFAP
jgi:hypothetical protein